MGFSLSVCLRFRSDTRTHWVRSICADVSGEVKTYSECFFLSFFLSLSLSLFLVSQLVKFRIWCTSCVLYLDIFMFTSWLEWIDLNFVILWVCTYIKEKQYVYWQLEFFNAISLTSVVLLTSYCIINSWNVIISLLWLKWMSSLWQFCLYILVSKYIMENNA